MPIFEASLDTTVRIDRLVRSSRWAIVSVGLWRLRPPLALDTWLFAPKHDFMKLATAQLFAWSSVSPSGGGWALGSRLDLPDLVPRYSFRCSNDDDSATKRHFYHFIAKAKAKTRRDKTRRNRAPKTPKNRVWTHTYLYRKRRRINQPRNGWGWESRWRDRHFCLHVLQWST